VEQILGDLDPGGQMARVIVQVDQPLDSKQGAPLLLDAYVEVLLSGTSIEAFAIPRRSLRPGDELFFVTPDTTLEIRKAKVLWRMADTVLVDGRVEAMSLVTGPVPTPLPGMKLRISEDRSAGEKRIPNTVKESASQTTKKSAAPAVKKGEAP
jgi:hypothetical protein